MCVRVRVTGSGLRCFVLRLIDLVDKKSFGVVSFCGRYFSSPQ